MRTREIQRRTFQVELATDMRDKIFQVGAKYLENTFMFGEFQGGTKELAHLGAGPE